MHSYSIVENALAAFFHVQAEGLAPFRARVRNLQKLGLKPIAPGRGNRVQYSFNDVCDLCLGLSFMDLGVNPSIAASVVKSGTFASQYNGRKRHCVYVPSSVTFAEGFILFLTATEIQQRLHRSERFSLVNAGLMVQILRMTFSEQEEGGDVSSKEDVDHLGR